MEKQQFRPLVRITDVKITESGKFVIAGQCEATIEEMPEIRERLRTLLEDH